MHGGQAGVACALSVVADTSRTNIYFSFTETGALTRIRLRHPGCGRRVLSCHILGTVMVIMGPMAPKPRGCGRHEFDCSLPGFSNLTLDCLLVSYFHPNMTQFHF